MNAEIKALKTAAETQLAEMFSAARATLPGQGDTPTRRDAAFRAFERDGLPHRHVEDWKYTDLRALMRDAKPLAALPSGAERDRAAIAGHAFEPVGARRLVFVNGAFAPQQSDLAGLEPGLRVTTLAAALAGNDPALIGRLAGTEGAQDDMAFALNTAFMSDGAVITVTDGAQITRPLHLVFVFAGDIAAATFSRSFVHVGKGASLTLLESYEGPDGVDYQSNTVIDLIVEDGARLDHAKLNEEGAAALHVSTLIAAIGEKARYCDVALTTGGAVVRHQLFVQCKGADAELDIHGATLIRRKQHVDTSLFLDHTTTGCTSRQIFKTVLDDESRGIFQGRITVQPVAQKTDARMVSNALLLSEDAEADNKPELIIFADDVQCGHGATVGALDEDQKFYLMARAIPEPEAEALLIQSFVGAAIDTVKHDGVRDALLAVAQDWIAART